MHNRGSDIVLQSDNKLESDLFKSIMQLMMTTEHFECHATDLYSETDYTF